jgi:hypothetical protein
MSESLPTPREERGPETGIQPGIPPMPLPNRHETIAYQPVSGWAVAGLVTSGLFAILVFASTMVALYQGAPVFFPLWLISLAVAGIVFSFVGVNHVQNSEGTRTGAKLARTGIWLGVVSSLCYFSYYFATRYAQETQADTFLRVEGVDAGFFPLLRESGVKPASLNRAFLLTRPITARSGNPDNPKSMALSNDTPGKEGGKGELSNFKESVMARTLYKDLGKDAEILPLAVQDWKYEKKSYQITRNYLIKTKEVDVEMQLVVASTESEASGQGRKWFVNLRESGVVKQSLTPYGEGVSRLRFLAREWLGQFLDSLNKGQSFDALKNMDQTRWDNLILQDQKPDEVRAALYRVFRSSKAGRLQGFAILTRPDEVGFWEMAEGKVRFHLHFRLTTAKEAIPPTPSHVLEGFVTVESRQAVDPGKFDVASPPPDWALIGITVTHVSAPGGPGGGPTP